MEKWVILLTCRSSFADCAWVGSNPTPYRIPWARKQGHAQLKGAEDSVTLSASCLHRLLCCSPHCTPSPGTTTLLFNTKPSICETSTQHLYFISTCLIFLVVHTVLFNLEAIWAGKPRKEWNAFPLLSKLAKLKGALPPPVVLEVN